MTVSRRRIVLGGSALFASGLLAACSPARDESPAASSPGSASASVAAPPPAGEPVAWPDVRRVPHLFFHSLVVDPDRAFHVEQSEADGYLNFMVTLDEFTRILEQVYARGYVLVSPHELYEVGEDDVVRPRPRDDARRGRLGGIGGLCDRRGGEELRRRGGRAGRLGVVVEQSLPRGPVPHVDPDRGPEHGVGEHGRESLPQDLTPW